MAVDNELDIREKKAREKLSQYGQSHVMNEYETLSLKEKEELLTQIEKLDFSVTKQVNGPRESSNRGEISPIKTLEMKDIKKDEDHYRETGLDAIRKGKVGAVLLAGGMGTRLGSDKPKCMYDIGITHTVYIMQRLMENTLDVVREAGVYIPFFIMTSEKNHDDTVAFLKEQNYFGYDPDKIHVFQQDMAPATDYDGKVYMESHSKIASSPNGNGGWFSSMAKAGLVDLIRKEGIEWLNCFAVDNVLQRIADPVFIGATIEHGCASGAKVVRKAEPKEKIGTICLEDGKPSVVEYYEMTDELLNAKDENGNSAYNFGVILNYLFREQDLEKVMNDKLMLHIVEKKIPYLNEKNEFVKPQKANGYKFETLILDMVHEVGTCLPYEVDRVREFAPIKNKTGIDSVESAQKLCQQNGIVL